MIYILTIDGTPEPKAFTSLKRVCQIADISYRAAIKSLQSSTIHKDIKDGHFIGVSRAEIVREPARNKGFKA